MRLSAQGTDLVDVVVLAGGTGRRLGGASKPDVRARGARLLDHVLDGLGSLRGPRRETDGLDLGRVVVVAPTRVVLPGGVLRAMEDPPLGGPVAGVAAGLLELERAAGTVGQVPASWTALLACDAPESWQALPLLVQATRQQDVGDGVVAVQDEHVQYLVGLYSTRTLLSHVAPEGLALRDVAVRRVLSRLTLTHLDLGAQRRTTRDLDTWEDVRAWEGSAPQPPLSGPHHPAAPGRGAPAGQ